jgi:hypothetical protein
VMTYPQSGDWWQVRSGQGVFGYLNRAQLRIASPLPPPPASRPVERAAEQAVVPATPPSGDPAPQPAQEPVAPATNDRIRVQTTDQTLVNRRRYCAGAGRNTPQCRQLRQRAQIRNY